jgi:hypothetical protein
MAVGPAMPAPDPRLPARRRPLHLWQSPPFAGEERKTQKGRIDYNPPLDIATSFVRHVSGHVSACLSSVRFGSPLRLNLHIASLASD